MKFYKTSGLVYGKDWGFGMSAYPAEKGNYHSYKELKEDIEKGIKEGSLDSGMGFQSLKGALIIIETIRRIVFKGRSYYNSAFKRVYFGDLSHKEKCFLSRCDF